MSKLNKTLTLKRAWLEAESVRTLEDIVRKIEENLPDKRERQLARDLFRTYEIADIKKSKNSGFFVRIHGADDNSILLIDKVSRTAKDELLSHEAPDDTAFLHAEIIFYVVGNDAVFCDLAGKEGIVESLLESVFSRAENANDKIKIKLTDVPNKNEIERINRVGVKRIDFGLVDYLGKIDGIVGQSIIKQIFSKTPDGASTKDRAHARGRIMLTRDKFKKDEIRRNEWLTFMGREILEHSSDYVIELEDKSEISPHALRISKSVKFDNKSGGISYFKAQLELERYYEHLRNSGVIGG